MAIFKTIKLNLTKTLKVSLNTLYACTNYRIRSRHKNMYRHIIKPQLDKLNISPISSELYPINCEYLFSTSGRRLDTSNYCYMVKLLEDTLVSCNILLDDSPRYVGSILVASQKSDDKTDTVTINLSADSKKKDSLDVPLFQNLPRQNSR